MDSVHQMMYTVGVHTCYCVKEIYSAYSCDGVVMDNALFPIECWDYKLPIFTELMVSDSHETNTGKPISEQPGYHTSCILHNHVTSAFTAF